MRKGKQIGKVLLLAVLPLLALGQLLAAQGMASPQRPFTIHDFLPATNPYGYAAAAYTQHLLSVFDLATNTPLTDPIIDLLPEGRDPFEAQMNPAGTEVWIAGFSGDGVVVVAAQTNEITTRIANVGNTPVDIAFSKDGSLAYVSNRDSTNVTRIDTSSYTVIDTFPIVSTLDANPEPGKMTLDPCTGELYMTNYFSNLLWRVDPVAGAVVQEVPVGSRLWDVAIDPQAATLYVTDRNPAGDEVHVFDTATLTRQLGIPVGDDPWSIHITPNGRFLFIANEDDGTVNIIDTTTLTVTQTITLSIPGSSERPQPRDVAISASGAYAYVPSGDVGLATIDDAVLVIDTATQAQVGSITVGAVRKPVVVAVAPPHPSLDPIPSFTVNTPLVLGRNAAFFDTSGNQPTAWLWDFGDGLGSATVQNPVYNYANPGTYTVTLTATNACGSQSTAMLVEVLAEAKTYLPVVQRP